MSSLTDSFLSARRSRVHKSKAGDEVETYELDDLWFDDGNIIIRTILSTQHQKGLHRLQTSQIHPRFAFKFFPWLIQWATECI